MIASIVRRSSARGRAPRIPAAAIAASNLAHWASVKTCIVSPLSSTLANSGWADGGWVAEQVVR